MTYQQIVTPNPDIPCTPGWCLQYVRQTFGAPAVEPTATTGWNNAQYRHADYSFPDGCWVPVWFSLATEPAGHVALMAPDGSVYSTSDESTTAHHHPSLQDLIDYYWRNPLTYLGWTEDISGVRVVQDAPSIQVQSATITPAQEDPLSSAEVQELKDFIQQVADVDRSYIPDQVVKAVNEFTQAASDVTRNWLFDQTPAAVWNRQVTFPDGTVTNLAGALAAIHAAIGTAPAAVPASVDVDALVARLKAELPAAVLAQLTAKLSQ